MRYYRHMIVTFRCRNTESLFNGQRVARFANIEAVAVRKLQMLHAAHNVHDLRVPPNNRLEALKGERKGQYSIRVNDQWRICFRFANGGASHVEIVDYH